MYSKIDCIGHGLRPFGLEAFDPIISMVKSLLPKGGWVFSVQASFDDSGNSDTSLTVVAGYFFRDSSLEPFRDQWQRLLGGRRFHMVDLVHGNRDFADMDQTTRNAMVVELIACIKEHALFGIAVSIEQAAYNKYVDELDGVRASVGSSYVLCSMLCLANAARWIEQEHIQQEETVYFFESGNSKQGEANRFLDKITSNPAMDQRYKYVAHSFIKKNKLATLDAADLLGWEWTQQCRRISGKETRPQRASLISLSEKPHILTHFTNADARLAFVKALLEPFVSVGAGNRSNFMRPEPFEGIA